MVRDTPLFSPRASHATQDLTDGMELLSLEGDSLIVDLSDGVVIDGIGSDATVIAPDNIAGNSVVHIIDTVRPCFHLRRRLGRIAGTNTGSYFFSFLLQVRTATRTTLSMLNASRCPHLVHVLRVSGSSSVRPGGRPGWRGARAGA